MQERDPLEDLVVEGHIILKRILKKLDGRTCTGLIWLRVRSGDGV